jgi:ABC-type transporter MlaC component
MRITRVFSLAIIPVVLAAGIVLAGEPTDQLRRSVDEVLKVVQSQREGAARRTEIRRIASGLFDFEETAKRALGPHWRQRTPAEREEFVKLFTDLLEAAYVGESVEGDQATVKSSYQDLVTRMRAKGFSAPEGSRARFLLASRRRCI